MPLSFPVIRDGYDPKVQSSTKSSLTFGFLASTAALSDQASPSNNSSDVTSEADIRTVIPEKTPKTWASLLKSEVNIPSKPLVVPVNFVPAEESEKGKYIY